VRNKNFKLVTSCANEYMVSYCAWNINIELVLLWYYICGKVTSYGMLSAIPQNRMVKRQQEHAACSEKKNVLENVEVTVIYIYIYIIYIYISQ
jgi:hypothetical protein